MNAIIEECTDPRRRAVLTPAKLREALGLDASAEMKIEPDTDGKGGFTVVILYTAPPAAAQPPKPVVVEIPKPPKKAKDAAPATAPAPAVDDTP